MGDGVPGDGGKSGVNSEDLNALIALCKSALDGGLSGLLDQSRTKLEGVLQALEAAAKAENNIPILKEIDEAKAIVDRAIKNQDGPAGAGATRGAGAGT